jgi:hypothetical protein
MQSLINVLALASFGVSACVVGAGVYVYQNKDAIVSSVVNTAVSQAMPEVPDILGGATPLPSGGGVEDMTIPPVTLPF